MITLNQCQCMLCAGVEVDACASSWHLPRPEGCRGEGNSEVCEGPGGMDPIVVYLRGVLVRGIWRARALRDSLSVLSLFPTRAALRGKVLSG